MGNLSVSPNLLAALAAGGAPQWTQTNQALGNAAANQARSQEEQQQSGLIAAQTQQELIKTQQMRQQMQDQAYLRYALAQDAAQNQPGSVAAGNQSAPPAGPIPQNPIGIPASPMLPSGAAPAPSPTGAATPEAEAAAPATQPRDRWANVFNIASAQKNANPANIVAMIKPMMDMEKDYAATRQAIAEAGQKEQATQQTAAKMEQDVQDQVSGVPLMRLKQAGWDPAAAPSIFNDAMNLLPSEFQDPGQRQRAAKYLQGLAQLASSATTPDGVQAALEPTYMKTTAASKESELTKAQSEVEKNTAAVTESNARAKQAQSEADFNDFKLKLIQGAQSAPPGDTSVVDQILPADKFPVLNGDFKSRLGEVRPTLDDLDGSKGRAVVLNQMMDTAKEVAPEIIQSKANQARANAQATAGPEMQRALTVASVNRAQSGAEKLDTDYNNALGSVNALGSILDAIDKGNTAAGAALNPVSAATILSGIKNARISTQLINEAGGQEAGNLWQRIQGYTEKQLTGDSNIIPKIREDVRELHQILGENSYQQYTQGLRSLSQRTGQNLQPTLPAPNIRQGASQGMPARPASIPAGAQAQYSPSRKQWRYSTDGGKTWQMPPRQ